MTKQVTGEISEVLANLQKLREPFPPESISKLDKGRGVLLDYVGHAETTDRLLNADPFWTWEPYATDERGCPILDYTQEGVPVGLWIRLTVCGVTRPGYGSVVPNNFKTDYVKELIGDAIRNAAMRFGVALDLWAKSDLESQIGHHESHTNGVVSHPESTHAPRANRAATGRTAPRNAPSNGIDESKMVVPFGNDKGTPFRELDLTQLKYWENLTAGNLDPNSKYYQEKFVESNQKRLDYIRGLIMQQEGGDFREAMERDLDPAPNGKPKQDMKLEPMQALMKMCEGYGFCTDQHGRAVVTHIQNVLTSEDFNPIIHRETVVPAFNIIRSHYERKAAATAAGDVDNPDYDVFDGQ